MVDLRLRLVWLVEIYYDTIHPTQYSRDRAESIALWWRVPGFYARAFRVDTGTLV